MYNKVTFTAENGHSISHILNEKSTDLINKSPMACKNKYKCKWLVWTVPESGWWDGGLLRDGTRWMLCGLLCCPRCRTQVDEDQLRILINFDILFWSSWKFIIHIKTIISLWSCQAQYACFIFDHEIKKHWLCSKMSLLMSPYKCEYFAATQLNRMVRF